MNITLSADEKNIEAARAWAAAHGTSLNALIRDYLANLVNRMEMEESARLFGENARTGAGHSAPETRFHRDDLYRGRRFGSGE
jgi:plasmid stability protein